MLNFSEKNFFFYAVLFASFALNGVGLGSPEALPFTVPIATLGATAILARLYYRPIFESEPISFQGTEYKFPTPVKPFHWGDFGIETILVAAGIVLSIYFSPIWATLGAVLGVTIGTFWCERSLKTFLQEYAEQKEKLEKTMASFGNAAAA